MVNAIPLQMIVIVMIQSGIHIQLRFLLFPSLLFSWFMFPLSVLLLFVDELLLSVLLLFVDELLLSVLLLFVDMVMVFCIPIVVHCVLVGI